MDFIQPKATLPFFFFGLCTRNAMVSYRYSDFSIHAHTHGSSAMNLGHHGHSQLGLALPLFYAIGYVPPSGEVSFGHPYINCRIQTFVSKAPGLVLYTGLVQASGIIQLAALFLHSRSNWTLCIHCASCSVCSCCMRMRQITSSRSRNSYSYPAVVEDGQTYYAPRHWDLYQRNTE